MKIVHSEVFGDAVIALVEEGQAEDSQSMTAGYLRVYTPHGEAEYGCLWDEHRIVTFLSIVRALTYNERRFFKEAGFNLGSYG